jgi:hypothetical protein
MSREPENKPSPELVDRAMRAFDRLDRLGKSLSSFGGKNRDEVRANFEREDAWTLENIVIEEMEYEIQSEDNRNNL